MHDPSSLDLKTWRPPTVLDGEQIVMAIADAITKLRPGDRLEVVRHAPGSPTEWTVSLKSPEAPRV